MTKQDDTPVASLPPVKRTAEGLRDALFDELNLIRSGKTGTARARAVAMVARNIIDAARLDLYMAGRVGEIAGKATLKLGSGK